MTLSVTSQPPGMTHHYDLETFTNLIPGAIGGATTFAYAKVKNAIGRIGIFEISFHIVVKQFDSFTLGKVPNFEKSKEKKS